MITIYGGRGVDDLYGHGGDDLIYGDSDHEVSVFESILASGVGTVSGAQFAYDYAKTQKIEQSQEYTRPFNEKKLPGAVSGEIDNIEGGWGNDIIFWRRS